MDRLDEIRFKAKIENGLYKVVKLDSGCITIEVNGKHRELNFNLGYTFKLKKLVQRFNGYVLIEQCETNEIRIDMFNNIG